MAKRDIHEEQEIGIVALLSKGQAADSVVTFVISKDGEEHERVDGKIVADAGAPRGKAATCKYKAPLVPKDKPSFKLTYYVLAEGKEYKNDDEIHVWPRKGKLEVVKNEDDKLPFPGFKFKVMQGGKQHGPTHITKSAKDGDPAVAEFALGTGAFEIEHVDPYEIKSKEQNAGALRDLKAKGVLNFTAEFVKPTVPADKQIKQWVNLASTKSGQDGLGNKIVLQVGVQGDRDDKGQPKKEQIGKAGLFVYVKVEFGPATKSARNSPKTELLAGKNLSDLQEKTALKEYTGKIELKEAGGVGECEICLGHAGGDTCKVSIGSTAEANQASATFTNWRKLYYELLAPDFMPLVEKTLDDGSKTKDLPADMTAETTALGIDTFTDFVVDKAHLFDEAKAPDGTILPRTFIDRTTGPAKVYILTDHTFTKMPTGVAFGNAKAPLSVPLKLCDDNLFAETADHNAPKTLSPAVTAAAAEIALPANTYWLPKSGFDGNDSIRELKWEAAVTFAAYKGKPKITVAMDATDIPSGSDRKRVYDVKEIKQNKTHRVTFSRLVGDVATSLSGAEKTALATWFRGLTGDVAALRKDGLQFQIKGDRKGGHSNTRGDNIEAELKSLVASAAPDIPTHAGLADDGTPRKGDLKFATGAADSTIDMTRSTKRKIAVNLPAAKPEDAGSLAGALSATKCPIKLTVKFTGHHGGLGLASGGKILTVMNSAHPKSSTKIVIHELGHLMKLSGDGVADDGLSPGLPKRKDVTADLTVDAYKSGGDKGHTYTGKGHSGPHCAYGLTDANKTLAKYDTASANAKCIMFGSASFNDATVGTRKMCPECAVYAKARDVSTL